MKLRTMIGCMPRRAAWLMALAGLLGLASVAPANNISVTNATVQGMTASTAMVKFDIAWENSWRYTNINHDAAWVFCKVQKEGEVSNNWMHVMLEGSGKNPPGYSIGTGTDIELIVPPDRMGLFVRRSGEGAGPVSVHNVRATWNFASNGLTSAARVRIQILAIEMVYIPAGAFYLGSGGDEPGHFYQYTDGSQHTNPFPVSAETTSITVTNTSGNLYYVSGNPGDATGIISNTFPKGYAAFYCMKYELTQGQYADFLNKLTGTQWSNRVDTTKNGTSRYTISGSCTNVSASAPDRACNFLSWGDGCAYAAWACLRPMTELEFEKACRGPMNPVPNEFAWGSTASTNLSSENGTPGSGTETPNPATANVCYSGGMLGPTRVGIFATATSGRQEAGAGYYGVMELSGNVWEQCVTVGSADGRTFTGSLGSGVLDATGNATNSDWYASTATGSGKRGNRWDGNGIPYSLTSDRVLACTANTSRYPGEGFRCVRQAP